MSAFTRLAGAVCARPRAVAAAMAIAALAAGLYGANVAEKLLAGGMDVPGSESDRAAKRLTERLGIVSGDVVAMLYSPDVDVLAPEYVSSVLDGLEQLYEDEAVVGALTHYDTGLDSLVSRDKHRTIVLIDLAGTMSEMVAELPLSLIHI